MARPSSTDITYENFVDIVDEAKSLFSELAQKAPYLEFIEAAYNQFEKRRSTPSYLYDPKNLKPQWLKTFLDDAGVLTEDEWTQNEQLLIPVVQRIERFNTLAGGILRQIRRLGKGNTDYEVIKQGFLTEPLLETAHKWYESLEKIFDYFVDYQNYLSAALENSKIAKLTSEAKKNLAVSEQVAGAQEKMLEKSGALSRANVYFELAYGKKPTSETYSRWDWLFLKPFRYTHGYRQTARWWLAATVAAVVSTAVVATLLFVVMDIDFRKDNFEILTLVFIKALILVPLFYLIRFTVHGYRVNKHLEVLYTHRWALHQTLESYLELIERDGKVSASRMQQLLPITSFFYGEIETGYINKKEGLGDKSIEVIPEAFFNLFKKK